MVGERLTAIHEAAHAVAAVRFALLCDGANILPKAEGLGTRLGVMFGENGVDPDGELITLLAGYVAQLEVGDTKERARAHAAHDFDQAAGYLADGETLDQWIERARVFVRENWTAILRVADELVRRKRLSGNAIDVLVDVADGKTSEDQFERFMQRAPPL